MKTSSKIAIGGGVLAAGLLSLAGLRLLRRHPVGNENVPAPLKRVDLSRYIGQWYEIARYDQSFEQGCEDATAEYRLRPDGKIAVINRCNDEHGRAREAHGIAEIVDTQSNAKLRVSFFWPVRGDYWILDHADDYSWSIVGEPSGRYLWILARQLPSEEETERLFKRTSELGYDTSMLIRTKHQAASSFGGSI